MTAQLRILAALAAAASAQQRTPGELVLDELEQRARTTLSALQHAESAAQADAARSKLRKQLTDALGVDRLRKPAGVEARVVGSVARKGYRIEKIVLAGLPGVEIPAHLYLPASAAPKRTPAILFYNGHWWPDSKSRPDFQAFCINMARWGFAVLSFDPFGQGERGISQRDHRRTELLPVGVAQQGIAEYETRRALDYLLSRPEVDPERIGMTGASGGGFNTWITAALDDRIRVAVPVVGSSEFFLQIKHTRPLDWYRASEHCHFIPGLLRFADNHEFVAMAAPRPVLVINATDDPGFPIGNVADYGKRLYTSYNAAGKFAYFEDRATGHGYQKEKREAAYGWFLKWLANDGNGRPRLEPATATEPWDSEELRCFPPGRNRASGAGFLAEAERLIAAAKPTSAPPKLSDLLGVSGPYKVPPPANIRASAEVIQADTGSGFRIPVFVIRPEGKPKGVLIAVSDDGKGAAASEAMPLRALRDGWAIAAVDPRGIGELRVARPGWMAAVSLLLGESFVGRQARDIVSIWKSVSAAGGEVALYARGHGAGLAMTYALELGREEGLTPRAAVLQESFISVKHFGRRPGSAKSSSVLLGEDRFRTGPYDTEIPFHYFTTAMLDHFDLPDLIGRTQAPVVVMDPLDGDWGRLSESAARALLPANARVFVGVPADEVVERLQRQ